MDMPRAWDWAERNGCRVASSDLVALARAVIATYRAEPRAARNRTFLGSLAMAFWDAAIEAGFPDDAAAALSQWHSDTVNVAVLVLGRRTDLGAEPPADL